MYGVDDIVPSTRARARARLGALSSRRPPSILPNMSAVRRARRASEEETRGARYARADRDERQRRAAALRLVCESRLRCSHVCHLAPYLCAHVRSRRRPVDGALGCTDGVARRRAHDVGRPRPAGRVAAHRGPEEVRPTPRATPMPAVTARTRHRACDSVCVVQRHR
jgi:hypothetical protein